MTRPSRTLAARRARAVELRRASQPVRSSDRRLRTSVTGAAPGQVRQHRPRNTFYQRGWSDVSPYYRNMVTVDARWDK